MYSYIRGQGWILGDAQSVTINNHHITLERRKPEIGELFYYYPGRSLGKNMDSLIKHIIRFCDGNFGAALCEDTPRCRDAYRMDDPETEYVTITVTRTT